MPQVIAKTKLRQSFFEYLFEDRHGYLCLALANRGDADKARTSFRRIFYEWPHASKDLMEMIENSLINRHLWFAVHLFRSPKALKENAISGKLVYADLDQCDPSQVYPTPSIVTETSPGRFHALWKLNADIPPEVAADYSRRIAYRYSDNGADKSGWDIGQLLRVPYTKNFKYENSPEINVVTTSTEELNAQLFEVIPRPQTAEIEDYEDDSVPEVGDAEEILKRYQDAIRPTQILDWYLNEPDEGVDWSALMWRMINTCLECGMSEEDTFTVCAKAKCNKYERDRRPIRLLWREIQKASIHQKQIVATIGEEGDNLFIPEIAPEPATETILDKYQDWAKEATDALPVYHELCGFMVLSALLSSNLRLETADSTVTPNLWGMILGSSTMTRKTTAMRLSRQIIDYVDESIEISSDGSLEGILQELVNRPRLASMFFRDEISGFLSSAVKKDYMSGIIEVMTQLYDGDRFKRTLKSGVVRVEEPIFIFFGGGIAEDIYARLDHRFISSGFLPRFLFVSGNPEQEAFKSVGPPVEENINRRNEIFSSMADIYHTYNQTKAVKLGDSVIQHQPTYEVKLTPEAWKAQQQIEEKFILAANESYVKSLAEPVYVRLHRSGLKMSMLLAAARQEPNADNIVTCDVEDVTNAAYYIQRWGEFSIEVIRNAGKTDAIRTLEKVKRYITDNPGAFHGIIMRRFHLAKRQMDEVIDTLLDRGEIRKVKLTGKGGGSKYWAT